MIESEIWKFVIFVIACVLFGIFSGVDFSIKN